MSTKRKGDVRLQLYRIRVKYLSGQIGEATAEGNNGSWDCECGERLLGRCYFQFGHDCHTDCVCGAVYRVIGDTKKRALEVLQVGPSKVGVAA
jgi:hypothetical protein